MSKRNYPRLGIEPFGTHLLVSRDLDPIYVAFNQLRRDGYPLSQLRRWLIAYWCFYSAPVASWMSEAEGYGFWERMMIAGRNETESPAGGRWPRGHERRHFRGKNAVNSLTHLRTLYSEHPEKMLERVYPPYGVATVPQVPLKEIMKAAQIHVGFGPWISFKVADMLDRCLGLPVDFNAGAMFMFDDPVEAALKLWREKSRLPENAKPKDQQLVVTSVVEYLLDHFKDFRAPPLDDRTVNVQEIETILCKWKSHMNGHYPLNNDIDEINASLDAWKDTCPTVRDFRAAMPPRLESK